MIGGAPAAGKAGRRVVQSGAREAAIMATIYDEVYRRALDDPEGFWAARAEDIHWEKRWDRVLDASRPPYYRWFAGGVLNTCYNALDLHVDRGRGKQTALIYDSPVTQTVRAFTYFELRDEVARFAGALRRQGVEKGDRVIIYMPAVPEAVIAMLACARLGAIHSVVFGGFAPKELATRIDDAKPRLILTASCGIEPGRIVAYKPLLDEAIRMANSKPEAVILLQRPQAEAQMISGRDHDWAHSRRFCRRGARRQNRRLCALRRHRPALHSLHLRHDRNPQ